MAADKPDRTTGEVVEEREVRVTRTRGPGYVNPLGIVLAAVLVALIVWGLVVLL